MSEAPETSTGQQVTVQRVREIRVVNDPVPMWDTAAFEHLGRVASVMTDANLLPMTLTHTGPANNLEALPRQTVLARALLIANQSRIWDMDPLAVAQATSIVHNRLMYEGKLVHAIIEAKLGVRLGYEFGLWDTDHFVSVDDESGLNGAGERLAVRVYGHFPDEPERRTVEGSVGAWKTTGNGSPWSPATFRRQLRYRGAREWARAHSPGVILGVLTDDEAEDFGARQIEANRNSGIMDRLSPPIEGATGFDPAKVEAETSDTPKARARRAKKADTPQEAQEALQAGEAVEVPDAYETPAADDEKPISEVLEGDDIPEHLRRLAGGIPHDAETGEVIEEEPQSPPEDVPTAEEPSDTQVSVTDASEGSPEETSGLSDSSAPEAPSETPEPDLPEELASYIETVESADAWLTFKKAMATFYATETFKKLGDDGQNRIRAQTWHLVNEMGQNGGERVDPGADISAFRLWLEYTSDQEAIEGTFAFLQRGEQFRNAATQQQSGLKLAVNRRLEKIGGI